MSVLRDWLRDGDMRTVGGAAKVVKLVGKKPELTGELVGLLSDESAGVRMRAADALEKVSRTKRDWLQDYSSKLVKILQNTDQQEIQWHLAQILPRLNLSPSQASLVWARLKTLFEECRSVIVQTNSLEGLALISHQYHYKQSETQIILR